ncbi:MAG: tRNA (guanosine(37)-N1)-methyltransferase TrmD [Actinobacteria bacterium]|nr:tRNA (guanosine(37)-N1)-methyltransferase TrmD [Actinomycetota bacterium]
MRIDIVTLFPRMFDSVLNASLLGRAIESGTLEVKVHDLRAHGLGKHRSVDDEPYGGGAGMVMRPEPIFDAVEEIRDEQSHVVLLSPRGSLLRHDGVARLAEREHIILICGRYEGVDERVAEFLADAELSIGDYVLAGGELAAMVVVESVSRFVPGVMGNMTSLESESHSQGLLEYPQYTRPAQYRGHSVPEVLLSGHHGEVDRWRRAQSDRVTRERRPDFS